MVPSTEAVIWFWVLPGSCLSLATLTKCLISGPVPSQPSAPWQVGQQGQNMG